jgi:predicted RNA polymerase sigma factor
MAPRFAAVHVGRALLLDALSRPQDAIAAFERAVAVADDPRPYRVRLQEYRALLAKRGRTPGASSAQSAL